MEMISVSHFDDLYKPIDDFMTSIDLYKDRNDLTSQIIAVEGSVASFVKHGILHLKNIDSITDPKNKLRFNEISAEQAERNVRDCLRPMLIDFKHYRKKILEEERQKGLSCSIKANEGAGRIEDRQRKKSLSHSSFKPIKKYVNKNSELLLLIDGNRITLAKKDAPEKIKITRDKNEIFTKKEKKDVLWDLLKKFIDKKGIIFTDNEKLDKNHILRLNKKLYEFYGLPEKRPIKYFVSRDGKEKKVSHGKFNYKTGERPYYKSEIQLAKKDANVYDDKKENPYFEQTLNTGKKVNTKYCENGDDDFNNS